MRSVASSSSRRSRSMRRQRSRAHAPYCICSAATWKCASSSSRVPLPHHDARAALARRFQTGHGRIVAALTRRFGPEHLEVAENAAQEAYLRALERWPVEGPPDDPERRLVRVAHNAAIDALRREGSTETLDDRYAAPLTSTPDSDDEIRLMFLCCDPVLSHAAQVALVLNVAFGLGARQIAAAFL